MKQIVIILFIITFCKCQSKINSDIPSITIDPKQEYKIPLSEITEKLDMVELETTDSSLITKIVKVDTLANHYLIADRGNAVLIFDKTGKFIRKIGKRGKGPGELSNLMGLMSFWVDRKTGFIHLNNYFGPAYDVNGNFIDQKEERDKSILISYCYNDKIYSFNHHFKQNNQLFLQDTYFNITDLNTKETDSILIDRKQTSYFVYNVNHQTVFRNREHIYMFYSRIASPVRDYDTLFVIKKQNIEPFAKVKLIAQANSENIYNHIQKVFLSDRYLFIAHGYRKINSDMSKPPLLDFSHYYYDFKTQKGSNSHHGFIDDMGGSGNPVIIEPIEGGKMFYFLGEGEYSEKLKTELNPILYVGTFKE